MILKELFEELQKAIGLDEWDWKIVCTFSERWKVGIVDALLDLHYTDGTILAKALAACHGLSYLSGKDLICDFSEMEIDLFDDLIAVGAAPLFGNRLAICDPYDDHRGYLGNTLCMREMVVTERSALFETMRRQGQQEWYRRTLQELE